MSKTSPGCWNSRYYGQMVKMCRTQSTGTCMKFYGLLSEIVLSHDNQNDIELVRFSVVCNVHNIINHWNCS